MKRATAARPATFGVRKEKDSLVSSPDLPLGTSGLKAQLVIPTDPAIHGHFSIGATV